MKNTLRWLAMFVIAIVAVTLTGSFASAEVVHTGSRDLPLYLLGTTATYNFTKTTDLQGLWKKVQGPLRIAANFLFPEWDELQAFTNFDVNWSTREITAPMDLNEETGIASIPEGGWEARPSSVTTVDASFSWILLNGRFSITKTAKWIDVKDKGAMISSQIKFQGRKKMEAFGRKIKDFFYGSNTAVIAQITSAITNNTTTAITVVLTNAYAQTDITSASFCGGLLKVGEWVAFVRAAALVANSIGQVTSLTPATGTAIITFAVAPTLATSDSIVSANSLENTTLAGGTDYLAGMAGWLDALKTASLQGITSATYGGWAPSYANTTVGRFTNIKYRRMKQAIANLGGGSLTDLRWSQGVENDVFDQMQAGLRFSDAFSLEMDGSPKAKGVTIRAPRSMLPGYVFGYDKSAVQKMVLLPKPGQPSWDDAEKIPDRSGYVFPLDYPCQLVWLNRGNLAYETNKTEQ